MSRSKGAGGLADLIKRQGGERIRFFLLARITAAPCFSMSRRSKKRALAWKRFIDCSSDSHALPALTFML